MKEFIIKINRLRIKANIGAKEVEKSRKQVVMVDAEIHPASAIESIKDYLERTVNYSDIRNLIKDYFLKNKPDLIETASYEIANIIYRKFKCRSVRIRVSKFPYRDADSVTAEVLIEN